jgi:hypothetical protein
MALVSLLSVALICHFNSMLAIVSEIFTENVNVEEKYQDKLMIVFEALLYHLKSLNCEEKCYL